MMIMIIVVVLVLLFVNAINSSSADDYSNDVDFNNWLDKYHHIYKNSVNTNSISISSIYSNFIISTKYVNSINSNSDSTYTTSINQFSGMSNDDFIKYILISNSNNNASSIINKNSNHYVPSSSLSSSSLPSSFDWRNNNVTIVSNVKDQGFVGTCWAFSTTGNIEGVASLSSSSSVVSLSEEYFVDCDDTVDKDTNHADCSVFGGWPNLAYEFAITTSGVPSDSSYPYCAGTGDCYPCMLAPEKYCGPPPYSCNRYHHHHHHHLHYHHHHHHHHHRHHH